MKCQTPGFWGIVLHGSIPGMGVHYNQTVNLVRVHRGIGVSDHVADVVSDHESSVESECAVTTARMSFACVFLSYPPVSFDDLPIPRRSGTTTVWSFIRSAASGAHETLFSAYP